MHSSVGVFLATFVAILRCASCFVETGPTPHVPHVPHAPLDAAHRAPIDTFVDAEMRRERFPGLALGVFN